MTGSSTSRHWRKILTQVLFPMNFQNLCHPRGGILGQEAAELPKCQEHYVLYSKISPKRGIVGPKLVSHYLNETGRVTADGSPWTPRLAYFLISLSGVSQEKPVRQKKRTVGSKPQKAGKSQPHGRAKKRPRSSGTLSGASVSQSARKTHEPRSEPAARLSTDVDEWAHMLSRLGRVSRKDDDG